VKIVHVTDSFLPRIGGIERQVESLARQQEADGHQVRIVTAVPAGAPTGLDVVHAATSQLRTSLSPAQLRRLGHAVASTGADVVHVHFSVGSPLAVHAARAAERAGLPVAVTVHSLWPARFPTVQLLNLPFGWLSMSPTWSAVSTAAAELVARTLPGDQEVLVVPNIVNTTWWHPPVPRRADPGLVHVVTVGRLAGRKRVVEFIQIIAETRRRLSTTDARRLQVSIVGDGPRRLDVQALIAEHGLTDCVRLLGERSPTQIRFLLHAADVFVAPARRESFGIAALEARSAGLPVLGLRGNGLSDFIRHGRDGLLVDTDSELAGAIAGLVAAPARLAALHAGIDAQPPSITAPDAIRAAETLYAAAITRRTRQLPVTAGGRGR
jgi:glycosyltransferase involved in cell wall biosynthesis